MNEPIVIFHSSQFGDIRTADQNGKPLFSGNDVAKALGYTNPQKAIRDHCKGVTKRSGVSKTTNQHGATTEQTVEMAFIPESDVYRLVMRSKLPQAEQFQDWVVEEVLPSIRKHGGYLTPEKVEEAILNPDVIIRLATELKAERAKNTLLETCNQENVEKLKEQAPKVLFATAVETSDRSVLVAELAKIISQNGVEIGQNRLFKWLRKNGYLCSKGEYYNQPTQRSMEMELFELKKTSISKPDGSVLVSTTTKVSGKGQVYFVNKFLQTDK